MHETNLSPGATRRVDAEHRRWLIGIAISVTFGTFGAVMAWLSYSARTKPSVPTIVQVARPATGTSDSDKARHRRSNERH